MSESKTILKTGLNETLQKRLFLDHHNTKIGYLLARDANRELECYGCNVYEHPEQFTKLREYGKKFYVFAKFRQRK